jgi:hypothetical protein
MAASGSVAAFGRGYDRQPRVLREFLAAWLRRRDDNGLWERVVRASGAQQQAGKEQAGGGNENCVDAIHG